MQIYLIRHADAQPIGAEGIANDEERPLSERGLEQAKGLGMAFRRLAVPLAKVVHSPLLRARQTAEGLVQAGSFAPEVMLESAAIAPGKSSKKLARFLHELGMEHVALIGHEPDMSEHAAWLIGSKKAQLSFEKAAVACIVCAEEPGKGAGFLSWFVTPQWFVGQQG